MAAAALRISYRKLKTLLEGELQTRFGQQTARTKPGPRMLGFESRYGPWLVRTWFDCGRRSFYLHHIDASEIKLASHLSIQSLMGISSMTDWTQGPGVRNRPSDVALY